jgi:predicted nucleic acid-binding protein
MAYLLDTNVFIQAKNLHYGFDFCPAFWEWLIAQNSEQRVFSIEQVAGEIAAGADELSSWASERGSAFFLSADTAILPALARLSAWATSQTFKQSAVSTFLQVADYYLVAHALAHQHTVVTHEVPANSINVIKIPTACIANGVRWMTPYEMLRREKARFILGPQPETS